MGYKLTSFTNMIVQAEDLLNTASTNNRLFIAVHLGDSEEESEEFDKYRDCQILGAVYAQIRDVFASSPTTTSGNLPLPALSDLKRKLLTWHVDNETEIILYGPSMALAARGWWVLRWAGLHNVKILDGGLNAWIESGGPVAQGVFLPQIRKNQAALTLQEGHMPSITVKEVEKLTSDTVLIDARDKGSYYSGRIPRARCLPASNFWTPTSRLRTTQECKELFSSIDVNDQSQIVVYCGGGVLSAFEVLILYALGHNAKLFVGSWSEWNKQPERMALSDVEGEQL